MQVILTLVDAALVAFCIGVATPALIIAELRSARRSPDTSLAPQF